MKVYFNYTSGPERKYKCISKTGSRYTWSMLHCINFLMDSKYILETYKFKLFFSITNFGNQNISKSILEVYFIFRVQKYIWSIAQILAEQNTNKSLHNLWSNGLVVRVQVYQTKDPRFKTIRWLLNCPSYHPSKVSLMNIKDSWGLDD